MADDRGTRNAVGHMARPIVVPWSCHKTGDCCKVPGQITVTTAERQILDGLKDVASRPLIWTTAKADGFVHLDVGPCPFLGDSGLCQVYESRPYNCRRMMCGRVDPARESYEQGGPMGCHNLSDRIETSLRFEEFYKANERRAAKEWATSHGWTKSQSPAVKLHQTIGETTT